jgi:hypothetical protein
MTYREFVNQFRVFDVSSKNPLDLPDVSVIKIPLVLHNWIVNCARALFFFLTAGECAHIVSTHTYSGKLGSGAVQYAWLILPMCSDALFC